MFKVCRSSTVYVTWFLISALLDFGGSGMELFSGLGGVTAANALRAVTNVLVGLSLLLADFKFYGVVQRYCLYQQRKEGVAAV